MAARRRLVWLSTTCRVVVKIHRTRQRSAGPVRSKRRRERALNVLYESELDFRALPQDVGLAPEACAADSIERPPPWRLPVRRHDGPYSVRLDVGSLRTVELGDCWR